MPEAAKQAWFTVFETPIGHCAIAWTRKGVVRFLLPAATAEETEERMRAACPQAEKTAPRGWVAGVIARVRKHLAGEHDDFADVPLDTRDLPPFFASVYEALRRVPAGTTTTYGSLGRKISGTTGAARAVGTAMAKNPFALLVPCHRVVGSDGKLHGFSAPGGLATKAKLLEIEGRKVPQQASLFGDVVASEGAASQGAAAEAEGAAVVGAARADGGDVAAGAVSSPEPTPSP
ncbi:MAG: methylated-DNA--[protein]-cysteine S-methyltransferase [Polyangiaceae bacterium]